MLAVIILTALLGFHFVGGYDWIDALWMVVITISSVGYGEHSISSPIVQILTILVIILGMSASVYTFGGFIQLLLEGEIERAVGRRRMTRDIGHLSDHIIICGFGRTGTILCEDLVRKKFPFVVIENQPEKARDAESRRLLCLIGDATEETMLEEAGLKRARTLFTGLPADADNVFITLTARNLNPTIEIISRAEHPSTERKLRQAGADKIIMPTLIGAHHVERMITRPSTADLMELVAESSFADLELDEVCIQEDSSLQALSVEETEARRTNNLLVVAIKQPDGKLIFNPEASYRFKVGDIPMLMGHRADIERFREKYRV